MSTHSSPHRSDRAVSREKTISSAAGNEFHHGSPSPAAIEPVQLEPEIPRQLQPPINLISSARTTPSVQILEDDIAGGSEEPDIFPGGDIKPFFTLIEDPTTGEYHRPVVHYIFADDDPQLLTSAALETFTAEPPSSPPSSAPRRNEREERFVIIDLAADGKTVTATTSLSPEWQALETHATQAPSWESEDDGSDRGVMLRISGQEVDGEGAGKTRKASETVDVDALIKSFDQRLMNLDRVLGSTNIQMALQDAIAGQSNYENTV